MQWFGNKNASCCIEVLPFKFAKTQRLILFFSNPSPQFSCIVLMLPHGHTVTWCYGDTLNTSSAIGAMFILLGVCICRIFERGNGPSSARSILASWVKVTFLRQTPLCAVKYELLLSFIFVSQLLYCEVICNLIGSFWFDPSKVTDKFLALQNYPS